MTSARRAASPAWRASRSAQSPARPAVMTATATTAYAALVRRPSTHHLGPIVRILFQVRSLSNPVGQRILAHATRRATPGPPTAHRTTPHRDGRPVDAPTVSGRRGSDPAPGRI